MIFTLNSIIFYLFVYSTSMITICFSKNIFIVIFCFFYLLEWLSGVEHIFGFNAENFSIVIALNSSLILPTKNAFESL